jgi:hypothetical protein
MNNLFSVALIVQTLCAVLFIIHRFFKALGSNLMFGIYIISFVIGCYLLWNAFKNPDIVGIQKILGIVLGILPFICILFMIFFITNFKMH